jgi:SAM-dependent methyltransferase
MIASGPLEVLNIDTILGARRREAPVKYPTRRASMDYAGGEYREFNPDWHAGDSRWKADQVRGMITRNQLAPRNVLEIGCGAGGVLASLASSGLGGETEFLGVDIAPDAIEQASSTHGDDPHLVFRVGDISDVDQSFDVVLLIDVIEHVEDYFGLLRGAREIARNLILHVPLEFTASSALRRHVLAEARTSVGHIHHFTKETCLATLRDTGFQVVDCVYTAGSLDLPAKRLRTKAASLPRRIIRTVNPDLAAHALGGFSLLILARPR